MRRRLHRRVGAGPAEDPRRSGTGVPRRHLPVGQAASDGRHPDAALRPRQAPPLRQQDLRADVARLPPGLHLLRRAADERAEVPLPADRRGDVRGRQLRLAHDLHQRRRLLRHAGAAEGSHEGAEGPQGPLAGGRHLEARAGRPHAGARRRKRLHHALDRLRVDLARHAEERPQAREPAGPVRRAGREGAFLRDRRVRPLHVRLRRRRHRHVSGDGAASTSRRTTTPSPIRC